MHTDIDSIKLPEGFPWGVALVRSKGGLLLTANAHMQEIYRCESGLCVDDIFHFYHGEKFTAVIENLGVGHTWTGRIYPQKNRHGIASVEVMFQKDAEDPSKVWLYTLEHPKVENELRYSSRSELKMLQVLLDNTLEYIYFRDPGGHFILTNTAFRAAVSDGDTFPQMDNTIADFVSQESAEWFRGLDRELVEGGEPVVNRVSSVTLKSGLEHCLQLSIVPVRNGEGELIGTLSVARDISALKRTEEELRHAIDQAHAASRAKGEFLAAMSHEIRTPINGIIGASELCEETELDQEQRSYIDTVLQCGNTLLSLVNDVLDFSKIEAGQLNLEKLNFVPRTLMENVAESFVQETRKKGVELITAYDEDLPLYLMGDPTRLKQVLNNLVSNAVKFTETGEIIIRAKTMEVAPESTRVRFSVRDTGIGISETRTEAIFNSFTQEDMSTTRKYGGSGLGLSISRQLVEMMGGEIEVTSRVGQGSVFSFEVPFELSLYHGAEAVPFNPELAGMRVLIVDDNKTNREVYSQMCAGWGYRSAVVEGGARALAEMEKAVQDNDPFELVILDQQMPGMSGLDLASLIHSRSSFKSVKQILLSSSLDRDEADRAAEIGVARALSKPVKRDTLLEVILETFEVGNGFKRMGDRPKLRERKNLSLEVLLVEDNRVNQIVAEKRLKKLGHQVMVAENSTEALEAVRQQRFDCILMDIQMPGMDGYETTQAIRAYEDELKVSPQYIVAMTAHAMKGDQERCLVAGMNDYIAKPFRVERLKEVLLRAMSLKDKEVGATSDPVSEFVQYYGSLNSEEREDLMLAAQIFIENLPEDVGELQDALRAVNFKQCYFMAHNFKSVLGHFGQEESVSLARALERACEQEQEEQVFRLARALIEALNRLACELQAEIGEAKPQV
ncbi:MAG: response regulator [Opitutales bacterium]